MSDLKQLSVAATKSLEIRLQRLADASKDVPRIGEDVAGHFHRLFMEMSQEIEDLRFEVNRLKQTGQS